VDSTMAGGCATPANSDPCPKPISKPTSCRAQDVGNPGQTNKDGNPAYSIPSYLCYQRGKGVVSGGQPQMPGNRRPWPVFRTGTNNGDLLDRLRIGLPVAQAGMAGVGQRVFEVPDGNERVAGRCRWTSVSATWSALGALTIGQGAMGAARTTGARCCRSGSWRRFGRR
jgi:hypothetical protein